MQYRVSKSAGSRGHWIREEWGGQQPRQYGHTANKKKAPGTQRIRGLQAPERGLGYWILPEEDPF